MKKYIYTIGILIFLLTGCQKEEKLTASTIETFYQLPQGNQPYDATFVAFQKKYGTYFLYKFVDNDFRWNGTTRLLYMAKQGDTAFIQEAYDFLDKAFLQDYADDKLQQLLPYKILLSEGIHQLTVKATNPTGYDTLALNTEVFAGVNQVTFGYTNANLKGLSAIKKTELQANLHKTFFTYALGRNKLTVPTAFANLFVATGNSSKTYKNLGFLEYKANYTVSLDFLLYVYSALRYNETQFKALYLTTGFDTSGLVAEKYAIIKDYLKTVWGIETESIANRVW